VIVYFQYYKGQQQRGSYKKNVQFLSDLIAEHLLDYVVYIPPIREWFLRQTSPGSLLSQHLWEKDGMGNTTVTTNHTPKKWSEFSNLILFGIPPSCRGRYLT
jgi:hypothetical protein